MADAGQGHVFRLLAVVLAMERVRREGGTRLLGLEYSLSVRGRQTLSGPLDVGDMGTSSH